MMFGTDRGQMRRYFCEVWARHLRGEPLNALAGLVAAVAEEHPEYHALLEHGEAVVEAEFPPEAGHTNPFLHMGMHLAIREQVGTDRPNGIARAHHRLAAGIGAHQAEHRIMDCLGESLWNAQRSGQAPDETAYLDCVQRLLGRNA
jgi:hypothetical protein